MLVLGKSFSLHFSQHHDCIIDAEAIGSGLVPNAFARFLGTTEAQLPRANFEAVEAACRMSSSGLLRGGVS